MRMLFTNNYSSKLIMEYLLSNSTSLYKGIYKTHSKLTKEQAQIYEILHKECPIKKGLLQSTKVEYFSGSQLVETLLQSKSAEKFRSNNGLHSRQEIVKYLQELNHHGIFIQVNRSTHPLSQKKLDKIIEKQKKEDLKYNDDDDGEIILSNKQSVKIVAGKKKSKKVPTILIKKKVMIHLIEENEFIDDSNYYYMWNYDPTSYATYAIACVIVGAIIFYYLSPIWPTTYHDYASYLTYVAFGFIGLFFAIVLFRTCLFLLVYIFTRGNVYFWLLPSFTNDCGFFDSFKPAYSISYYQASCDKKIMRSCSLKSIWNLLKESFHYIFEDDEYQND